MKAKRVTASAQTAPEVRMDGGKRVVNGVLFSAKAYEILKNYKPSADSKPATKDEIRALFEL